MANAKDTDNEPVDLQPYPSQAVLDEIRAGTYKPEAGEAAPEPDVDDAATKNAAADGSAAGYSTRAASPAAKPKG